MQLLETGRENQNNLGVRLYKRDIMKEFIFNMNEMELLICVDTIGELLLEKKVFTKEEYDKKRKELVERIYKPKLCKKCQKS